MEVNSVVLGSTAGAIVSIISAIYYAQNVSKNFKKEKEEYAAAILQSAKEHTNTVKIELLAQRAVIMTEIKSEIAELETKFDNQKDSVNKDMAHLRETYNGEIRVLGSKIEDLRSELRNQHGQLVGLLSKMLENRD